MIKKKSPEKAASDRLRAVGFATGESITWMRGKSRFVQELKMNEK